MDSGTRPPLEKIGLQRTTPPVFTGTGSVAFEKTTNTKTGPKSHTCFEKIESRIYEMMYIVPVYSYIHIYA